ncbi:unnamed protein product [Didymodactylos carnosus]|uniref:Uncharacterized protein n=1 Tax=Didymodactylos carnosus TaxID=1234261 RepID=A0A8S2EMX7_9BILA|nr:unnamed protein product [Didymodactylos carnosus]CAF4067838.1 unnamed protein product [Didymodactylos carnosus]
MSLDVVRSLSTICSQTHFSPSVVATVPLFRPPPSCSKAVEEVILNEEARDGASTCHQTNINMLVQKDSFDVNKFLQRYTAKKSTKTMKKEKKKSML